MQTTPARARHRERRGLQRLRGGPDGWAWWDGAGGENLGGPPGPRLAVCLHVGFGRTGPSRLAAEDELGWPQRRQVGHLWLVLPNAEARPAQAGIRCFAVETVVFGGHTPTVHVWHMEQGMRGKAWGTSQELVSAGALLGIRSL